MISLIFPFWKIRWRRPVSSVQVREMILARLQKDHASERVLRWHLNFRGARLSLNDLRQTMDRLESQGIVHSYRLLKGSADEFYDVRYYCLTVDGTLMIESKDQRP